MSVRSRIAALVVALAVAATTIAGGVAQAAPLVPCATLSVGSVAPATVGYQCAPYDATYDPMPLETGPGDAHNASAMTESGDRMAFVRTAPNATDCPSATGNTALALNIGAFRAAAAQWVAAPLLSQDCKEIKTQKLTVTLNSAGTAGAVMFGVSQPAANNDAGYTDDTAYVVTFTVSSTLQTVWGAPQRMGTCTHGTQCIGHFWPKLHSSLNGDLVASVVKYGGDVVNSASAVAHYNAATATWTQSSLSGEVVFDSGISRDGKLVYALGSKAQPSPSSAAKMTLNYCRVPYGTDCLLGGEYSWWGVSVAGADATSAISDNGGQIAVSWVSFIDSQVIGYATSFPLPTTSVVKEIAPNVRTVPGGLLFMNRNTLRTFLSPDGKRMWTTGVSRDRQDVVVQTATISGWQQTWADPFNSPNLALGLSDSMFGVAISRTGRLTAFASENSPGHTTVYYADSAIKASTWNKADVAQARNAPSHSISFATNAAATRWVASSATQGGSNQGVVAAGSFHSFVTSTSAPKITGTFAYDKTLSVSKGGWSVSGGTVTYQWLRDGEPISGARNNTFYVWQSEVGHRLSVRVTHNKPGTFERVVTTAQTPVITGQATMSFGIRGATGAGGAPQVGDVIDGDFQHAPVPVAATLAYVWKIGSRTLPADTSQYTIVPSDVGQIISLTVRVSSPGWKSATITVKSKKIVAAPVHVCALTSLVPYC